MDMTQAIILTIMTAATPLLLAAIGELVVERSGVLNLGVEGMMIMGAVSAFAIAQLTGSAGLGALGGLVAGMLFSLLFGFLTLTLVANQVATGLALTILGLGLSGMIGEAFIGLTRPEAGSNRDPASLRHSLLRTLAVFNQDPIFYTSIIAVIGVNWFLFRSRAGLGSEPSATAIPRRMRWGSRSCARAIWRLCSVAPARDLRGLTCPSSTRRNGWRT
jgi:ABC-type uncharacterized transport system permease subunit